MPVEAGGAALDREHLAAEDGEVSRLDAIEKRGQLPHPTGRPAQRTAEEVRLGAREVNDHRAAVARWLALNTGQAEPSTSRAWLRDVVRGLLALQRGDAEDALASAARAFDAPAGDFERRVAGLLALRAIQRAELDQLADVAVLRERVLAAVTASDGTLARSLRARCEALLAFDTRSDGPAAALASLARTAASLEATGDIGGLGVVYNVMAVLARRAHDKSAIRFSTRAVPCAVAAGDLPTLQAAIFNLAHARHDELVAGRGLDESVLELVDLCIEVCNRLGVGRDSCQAEILGARVAKGLGLQRNRVPL